MSYIRRKPFLADHQRGGPVAPWVRTMLLEHRVPERGQPGHDAWLGYRFTYENVPGLPPHDSAVLRALYRRIGIARTRSPDYKAEDAALAEHIERVLGR